MKKIMNIYDLSLVVSSLAITSRPHQKVICCMAHGKEDSFCSPLAIKFPSKKTNQEVARHKER